MRQNVNHVIAVHSAAHRLNFSALSSVKKGKYADEYDSVLKRLYTCYWYSPKSMGQLKQAVERLQ
jgi:hypothetical protein